MAKGFGGVPSHMQGLMKQAQKMQRDLEKAQAEALLLKGEGSAGGGAVTAVVTGENLIETLTMSAELVASADREMLQDLVTSAVNQAIRDVKKKTSDTMAKVTGGMSIPGLF